MPPLGAKERAQLPDSAFAYVDSRGRRRLPINDAAHVRNALARFSQVVFEDEGARDRARTRLLRAATRPGATRCRIIYAVAGLGIFGAFTIFAFNRLRRAEADSAVLIAVSIFLDIFNVFLLVLDLFVGARD
jgi:hypothetical protein